ncbi:MAG TPA: phage holin family protein [Flavobacterium sp.]|nr:phage holin family protein [Flavobacterium sp.]
MLYEKAENYTKTAIELAKLKLIDKSAEIVSSVVSMVVIAVVVGMFITMVNIGWAFWLGEKFHNTAYGFFTVGAFWFVVALLLILFKSKWLKTPASNFIITEILKEKVR